MRPRHSLIQSPKIYPHLLKFSPINHNHLSLFIPQRDHLPQNSVSQAKMQAAPPSASASASASSSLFLLRSSKISTSSRMISVPNKSVRCPLTSSSPRLVHPVKVTAGSSDPSAVDYSSMPSSVFPAEACETLGGEACDAEMYPEVKLQSEPKSNKEGANLETVDREYLEYNNNTKTVFPAEACDDLGGEFCEPEYQSGVY